VRLKKINDLYGHGRGDVLAAVGAVLLESVRQSDLVGRFGGEGFLAVTALALHRRNRKREYRREDPVGYR
jgi:diguanylate cyclase (GGDEF)-like protein